MAEPNRLSGHFRRTDPRYTRLLEVEIVAGETRHAATTRNISLGGMLVETAHPLAVKTTVVVRFRIPTQSDMVEVAGEVRWVEPGSPLNGVGIHFHGLRAREVWALNRFFQT